MVPTDNEPALAHEIGHLLGRAHAPCNNPAAPDPGYPNYGSYPRASIGEFGVDIETLDILNPATVTDFMSYCGPVWISGYTYEGLLDRLETCPGLTSCVSSAPVPSLLPIELAASRGEYLALTIQIYRNGRVRLVHPAFHLPAEPGADWGRETEYFVELRGEDGFPLSARRLWLQDAHVTAEDAVTCYLVRRTLAGSGLGIADSAGGHHSGALPDRTDAAASVRVIVERWNSEKTPHSELEIEPARRAIRGTVQSGWRRQMVRGRKLAGASVMRD